MLLDFIVWYMNLILFKYGLYFVRNYRDLARYIPKIVAILNLRLLLNFIQTIQLGIY